MKELKFNLKLEEAPVEITDVNGTNHTYKLRALNGAERDSFLNIMSGRMKYNDLGKMQGLKDYTDLHASLLSRCLYTDEEKLVTISELRLFPATVLAGLFDAAQELSGLDKEAKKAAKND